MIQFRHIDDITHQDFDIGLFTIKDNQFILMTTGNDHKGGERYIGSFHKSPSSMSHHGNGFYNIEDALKWMRSISNYWILDPKSQVGSFEYKLPPTKI